MLEEKIACIAMTDYHHSYFIHHSMTTTLFILLTGLFIMLANINIEAKAIDFKNATEYKFYQKWGSEGKDEGQFQRPHDLDFNPNETILYAVDRDGNRIQAFDKNGTFLFSFGELGTGDGQFHVPYGVDVDSNGNVWTADRANHRVQKFDSKGNFILKIGNENGKPSSNAWVVQ